MYQDLKKIYHMDEGRAESVYHARMEDSSAVPLTIAGRDFFYWMPPDVYARLLDIERIDRGIDSLADTMPSDAINRYIIDCMIDEIILTNEIEGVISTRKEVELAFEALRKNDKNKRFQGIVSKYVSLLSDDDIPMRSPEDVRALYDDLVLDEVVDADPNDAPDGDLFRVKTVTVVDAAQRVRHESAMSEKQISEELERWLGVYNDDGVEPLVRAAIFHFAFAYIHPFYDGNGRMNRFIGSYLVHRKSSRWAGIRLSFSVKENIRDYYKAFELAEHPLNKGDLTPFIITFLEIVLDALEKTNDALLERDEAFRVGMERLRDKFAADDSVDVESVGRALLQGALFTARGLTVDDIAEETGISVPTVYKRLDGYKDAGLLERKRSGRRAYYRLDADKLEQG